MSSRLAITIVSVAAFAFGVPLLVAPGVMLAASGIDASGTIAVARGAGATLVGLGVLDWLSRDASGAARRAVLVGNLAVQVLSLLVNAGSVLAGDLPFRAGIAAPIHLALAVVLAVALRRADRSSG